MERSGNWIQYIIDQADLSDEAIPGIPVVEIAGDQRVLIEGHNGITSYDSSSICVKVRFGYVRINGECLRISKMSKNALTISGSIRDVCLLRRDR